MALRGQSLTATKLLKISEVAKENNRYRFTSLVSLIDEEFLLQCYSELKKNKASGTDGVSLEEYGLSLQDNITNLHERMLRMSYRPKPVRRVNIPKDNGKTRPLGIPTVEDKIVQQAVTKILQSIYEPQFLDMSFGFRPGRSCHEALERVDFSIYARATSFIIDADIKGFFDNVKHDWMIKFLEHRIADRRLLRFVARFLKAGIIEEGKYYETEDGTPQGGILSPVLSNIYLHYVLDLWIMKQKTGLQEYIECVRYADDFVICVQSKKLAEKLLSELKMRLSKFGLELSEEKTRIIRFGRYAKGKEIRPKTFDFLGITHYCSVSHRGKFMVGRRTSRKKYRQKLKEMNLWLKRVRSHLPLSEIWKTLSLKLNGHYQYYGLSGNLRMVGNYYYHTRRLVYKWLNRRSQRRSMNWKEFLKYTEKYPLPTPRLPLSSYRY